MAKTHHSTDDDGPDDTSSSSGDDSSSSSSRGPFTAARIAALVTKDIEPDLAERVLAVLRALDGQIITTRLLDKLPGGRVAWRLNKQFGWTEIRNRVHVSSGGTHRDSVCLLLAHNEGATPLSADFVERENKEYFQARRDRNALRLKALADPPLLESVAIIANELQPVNKTRLKLKQQFAVFVAPGEPLAPCQVALERALGLREDEE